MSDIFFSNKGREFELRRQALGDGDMIKSGYFSKIRVGSLASKGILLCLVLLFIFKHWSQY